MSNILSRYGFVGGIRLLRDVVITRLFFKKCRIVRSPYYIRGKKFIEFGKGFTTGVNIRLDAFTENGKECLIKFGDNVEVNDYVHIAATKSITIGNNVLIASKVFISDHNHGNYRDIRGEEQSDPLVIPQKRKLVSSPVIIEDNVWIGEFVSILPGVKIGKGSIIGTLSVVNKDIPPYSIAVGTPAKVIKSYNFQTKKWESSNGTLSSM